MTPPTVGTVSIVTTENLREEPQERVCQRSTTIMAVDIEGFSDQESHIDRYVTSQNLLPTCHIEFCSN